MVAARAPAPLLTFAWGLYLACSWTWCIGMYLPKLLMDRFGWAGFIAFALPNIAGCAAFGYVVRNRARSETMVARHSKAMALFSIITLAYHALFVAMLLTWYMEASRVTLIGAAAIAAVCALLAASGRWQGDRAWLWTAAAVYVLSVFLCAPFVVSAAAPHDWTGPEGLSTLAWLTLPMMIGFAVCPYLDLTFHAAIQRSPSRHAFSVFGAAFAVMILLTCFIWPDDPRRLAPAALIHVLVQSVFTCGAHMRQLRVLRLTAARIPRAWLESFGTVTLAAAILLAGFTGITSGDRAYLRWLAWYGLVFPAYVLLFVGPGRPLALSRTSLIVTTLAIIALAPLYELAFIRDVGWVMAIPAAATIAWLLARRHMKRPPLQAGGQSP